jgi:hypothetical protein
LQATPFLTVAAFAEVVKEVVARNKPNVATSTDALTLFDAFDILNPTFTLALDAKNNLYRRSVYPKFK